MAAEHSPKPVTPIQRAALPAKNLRLGDVAAMLRLSRTLPVKAVADGDSLRRKRALFAEFCRMLEKQVTDVAADNRIDPGRSNGSTRSNNSEQVNARRAGNRSQDRLSSDSTVASSAKETSAPAVGSREQPARILSRRMAQTLELLLAGDAEKQIAGKLGLSPHTVHVYVKSLYRHYDVSSRGELLARWVKR